MQEVFTATTTRGSIPTIISSRLASTVTIPPIPTTSPSHFPHSPPPMEKHFYKADHPAHVALWVFFGLFAAGTIGTMVLAQRVNYRARVFHAIGTLTLAITTMAYLMMATGVGIFPSDWMIIAGKMREHHGHHGHPGHDHHGHPGHGHPGHPGHHHGHNHTHSLLGHKHGDHGHTRPGGPDHPAAPLVLIVRQMHWIRDAAHVLTAPMLTAALGVLSGLAPLTGLSAVVFAGFASFAAAMSTAFVSLRIEGRMRANGGYIAWMVVAGLWAIAMYAILLVPGVAAARQRRRKTQGLYFMLTGLMFTTFLVYTIIHMLGSGFNIIGVTAEVIALGIVDVASQLGFVYFLLFVHVHDEEDDTWTFPEWFAVPRTGNGPDGRGTYASVAAE